MQHSPPNIGADGRAEDADATSGRPIAWLFTIAGLIGTVAAFTLLIEKIALLKDPDYVPSCSINPILSCGSIMRTEQAEAFGFPNPIIGVAGFAAITTIGIAILSGAAFRRWFWIGIQVGATAGLVFVHWLIFQSLYRIDALCPYCMVVWAVTIALFWYVTVHNLQRATYRCGAVGRAIRFAWTYHAVVLTVWYLAVAALVGHHFWDYWKTLLT